MVSVQAVYVVVAMQAVDIIVAVHGFDVSAAVPLQAVVSSLTAARLFPVNDTFYTFYFFLNHANSIMKHPGNLRPHNGGRDVGILATCLMI